MRKLIMLITIIVMTSALLACNNDNEDYSEELKYTYEFEDITDIEIDVDNLELNINGFYQKSIRNKMIITTNYEIDNHSNNNSLNICTKISKKIKMNVDIYFSFFSNITVNSNLLFAYICNLTIENLSIQSLVASLDIDHVISNFLNEDIAWSYYTYNHIRDSEFKKIQLKYEKVFSKITNTVANSINITNNYGNTEFLKNSFNEFNYNSINGKIFMELDPNYGYTFDYNIKSYWSAFEPDQSNPGYYLYGDGERKVNVDAPKGDMEIVKYR